MRARKQLLPMLRGVRKALRRRVRRLGRGMPYTEREALWARFRDLLDACHREGLVTDRGREWLAHREHVIAKNYGCRS